MLGTAAILALTAFAGAGGPPRLELGVRTELRSRLLDPEGEEPISRTTFEVVPRVELRAGLPGVRLSGRYVPLLRVPDVASGVATDVTHAAELAVETATNDPWRLSATVSGTRGITDPLEDLWLSVGASTPTTVPTTDPQPFEGLGASGRAQLALSPRTEVVVDAAASMSRGRGQAALLVFPEQRTAAAGLVLEHVWSRRDLLRARLSASGARTLEQSDSGWATATGGWTRELTRTLLGTLGGGLSVSSEDREGARTVWLGPVFDARLRHAPPSGALSTELAVATSPSIDRFTGEVRELATASTVARWRALRPWTLAFEATAGSAWRDVDSRFGSLVVRTSWELRSRLVLALGARGLWQHESDPLRPSFFEGSTFLAFTVAPRPDLPPVGGAVPASPRPGASSGPPQPRGSRRRSRAAGRRRTAS